MRFKTVSVLLILLLLILLPCISALAGPLTLPERVACRQAIETVYWDHQIWPQENRRPKPGLKEVLPESAIREKVEDALLKSNALEQFWGRVLQGQQLQAEMDRMAAQTRDPRMLRDLWSALDNDPHLIAECLVRPVLADRLTRNWYATDQRIHGPLKDQVLRELADRTDVDALQTLSGRRTETRFVRSQNARASENPSVIGLNESEWNEQIQGLQKILNAASRDTIPSGKISILQEDADRYFVLAVLESTQDSLRVAEVSWNKTPFQEWWGRARRLVPQDVVERPYPYHLPAIGTSSCADDTWSPTPAPPLESYGHTAVWTGKEMIVWGGFHNVSYLTNVGGRYQPATDTWTPISPTGAPLDRALHTAVWTGTEMIVWGGYELGADTNTGARYNPTTDTWIPISSRNAAEPRIFHSAVWTGSEMIVWGGTNDSVGYLNSGGRYNLRLNRWTPLPSSSVPAPRALHTAVWTGNEMIIWGGSADTRSQILLFGDGARFNPAANKWFKISAIGAPTPRAAHSAVWTGSQMIVWGGFELSSGTSRGTGGMYDAASNAWRPTPITGAPEPRYWHSAAWTGTEMIVWGGVSGSGTERGVSGSRTDLVTGGRLNPATGVWRPLSTVNAPEGRTYQSTVWTGTEMIVWGGLRPTPPNSMNSGGRYDPATDSWTPTQNFNAPNSRWNHTAVWTGTEMIIWGGIPQMTGGGRFNPALNTWTPTATYHSPSVVYGHTAVWSGTEMIVWGGYLHPDYTNKGGRYNPLTDAWRTVAVDANTPSKRYYHSAVWTGTEMIVWGGIISGGTLFGDGGRYDPVSNTWLPVSTANAPDPRTGHTAIWTGAEMIVWGGAGPFSYFNSGGRYDPVQDIWQPTAIDPNTPTARSGHGAVWTGTEMIIWGADESSDMGTGSRYNPLADTWVSISTDNAPENRVRFGIVWTGSEMIVWGGGVPIIGGLNTGGRYSPASDTWRPTSLTGAPTARRYLTAVWSGQTMIIWGGVGGWNTGAQYCASQP